MLSIAIYSTLADDARDVRSLIQDFLINEKIMAKVTILTNPSEFLTVPGSYDIYIMDMDSEDDVIDLGKQMMEIDHGSYYIYISNNENVAHKAAKIHSDYFLTKPLDIEELTSILREIRQEIKEESIIIKTAEGERRISVSNLNYINIEKRCLCYHLKDGNIFDGQTLRGAFEKAIFPLQNNPIFVFLPPSLLINLGEIEILDDDHLQFRNGGILYFPKSAHDNLRQRWRTYHLVE